MFHHLLIIALLVFFLVVLLRWHVDNAGCGCKCRCGHHGAGCTCGFCTCGRERFLSKVFNSEPFLSKVFKREPLCVESVCEGMHNDTTKCPKCAKWLFGPDYYYLTGYPKSDAYHNLHLTLDENKMKL